MKRLTLAIMAAMLSACGSGVSNGDNIGTDSGKTNPPPYTGGIGGGTGGGTSSQFSVNWDKGTTLSSANTQASNPQLRLLNNSQALVVWAEGATQQAPSSLLFKIIELDKTTSYISNNGNTLEASQLQIPANWPADDTPAGTSPRYQLSQQQNGLVYAAWLTKSKELKLARYSSQSGSWVTTKIFTGITSETYFNLINGSNGDAIVTWQTGSQLNLLEWAANKATPSAPTVLTRKALPNRTALWLSNNNIDIAYLEAKNSTDTSLLWRTINPQTSDVSQATTLDDSKLKNNIVGTYHNGKTLVAWAEKDSNAEFSLTGVSLSGSTPTAINNLESLPNNSEQLTLSNLNSDTQLLWQQKTSNGSNSIYHTTLTASSPTKIDGTAQFPVVASNGNGLALVAQTTNGMAINYFNTNKWLGWQSPLCHSTQTNNNGTCPTNTSNQYQIAFNNNYGIATWVSRLAGVDSVVVARGEVKP